MVTRPLTHSQVLKESLAVARYNTRHSNEEGGDRGLATITATTLHLPLLQAAQFMSPGCTETKAWDVNKECWYLN